MTRQSLTGWGGTCPTVADVVRTDPTEEDLLGVGTTTLIARGLGRSYGDAAQNGGGRAIRLQECSDPVTVDAATETVTVQGGTSLATLLQQLVPQGWFLPVLPGTANVTIGGAIAADVHGKNHPDVGGFGSHVRSLTLVSPDGEHWLSPDREHAPWFWATVGGMGLTGIITSATLEVIPITTAFMCTITTVTSNIDQTLRTLCDSQDPHRVAWIDGSARGAGLGRGVVSTGSHITSAALPSSVSQPLQYTSASRLTVPRLPYPPIRRLAVRTFNRLWRARATEGPAIETLSSFFFPLDAINRWNRLYGNSGMLQWQIAIPDGQEEVLVDAMETLFGKTDPPACLVTLKRLGEHGHGHLSFPIAGWTMAVDFPARGLPLRRALRDLDKRVAAVGGRVYLAKDSRAQPETVASMYPRLGEWQRIQSLIDPARVLQSDLSTRLGLLADHPDA